MFLKAFVSLYRCRIFAYGLLFALMMVAGAYQADFTWEIVGPSIMLYLPTSLIARILSRVSGPPLPPGKSRGFDLPLGSWRFLVVPGVVLLGTHWFLADSYLPMVGMWTLLCSLEVYLIDVETAEIEKRCAASAVQASVEGTCFSALKSECGQPPSICRRSASLCLARYRRRLGFYAGLMLIASASYFTPTKFLINVLTYPVCVFLPLSLGFTVVRIRYGLFRTTRGRFRLRGIPVDAVLWVVIGTGAILVCSYLYIASLAVSILGMIIFLLSQEVLVIHDEQTTALSA